MRLTEQFADLPDDADQADAVLPTYPRGWLVGQLPVGMRDDDRLVRFTTIFERLGATLRASADGVEHVVDPTVTTPGMLALLGAWLGYDVVDDDLPTGTDLVTDPVEARKHIDRQRRIVAASGRALPWRGTARGLHLLLEAITGGPVQIEESGGVIASGERHEADGVVTVRLPSTGHLRHHELVALIRDEVPAHLAVHVIVTSSKPGDDLS